MSPAPWIDLAAGPPFDREIRADVCIVGAGAAGTYLARKLSDRGRRVVLVEAGPAKCVDAASMGFDVAFDSGPYPGATAGRFFGMGGSTSRWGGVLVPHTRLDLRDGAIGSENWVHIIETVERWSSTVLARLGYRAGSDEMWKPVPWPDGWYEARGSAGIEVHIGLHMPFSKRNFVNLLDERANATAAPLVVFNAVAKDWSIGSDASTGKTRIAGLAAVSHNGHSLRISAPNYVIAAGAIESARILLEIVESAATSVFRPTSAIGRYLSDHLSTRVAVVAERSRPSIVEAFAPRFEGAWMQSFRFLESRPPADIPRYFAHIIFAWPSAGFDVARTVLGALQRGRLPSISASRLMEGVGDMARLAYARYRHHALYVPFDANSHLQLDIEQVPLRDNRVFLSQDRDRFGRRALRVRWEVGDQDRANIERVSQRILTMWNGQGSPELKCVHHDLSASKPHDTYHPVGTCRMGEDAEAVVGRDLKVWGTENLWVISTGVIPSAGTANPTFTMLCLAEDLAEDLTATH